MEPKPKKWKLALVAVGGALAGVFLGSSQAVEGIILALSAILGL